SESQATRAVCKEATAMLDPTTIPPQRRSELLLRPIGEQGEHVVKDPQTGAYYNLGVQESFLLGSLDGVQSVAQICAAFEARFGEPFAAEDLEAFLDVAREQHFLRARN